MKFIALLCSPILLTALHAADEAPRVLFSDKPATKWANECYPIGNGRLGAMLFGGVNEEVIQFNEISLWSGDNNWDGDFKVGDHGFGNYRNFGEVRVRFGGSTRIESPSGHEKGNGQSIENASDNDPSTKWCIESPGDKVQWSISLPDPEALKSYAFTSAPDVPQRDPQKWILEGSEDGTKWATIDQQALTGPFEQRGQVKSFQIASPRPYTHYRFTFETKGYAHFQIAEIATPGLSASGTAQAPSGYRRELDIDSAIHRTTFSKNGTTFTREAFASHPDNVMVFQYQADKPGSLSGRISLISAQGAPAEAKGDQLTFTGQMPNTLKHAAALKLIPRGGKVRVEGKELVFENCDALTLLLDAHTNYKPDFKSNWRGEDPGPRINADFAAVAKKDVPTLRKAHLADITPLMKRARIDIGTTPADLAALPTAERKARYAAGGNDPDLEELLFQYGRYLLAGSSRPGGLPANLQGLWCDSNNPPWASDYHTNINIQMNYWAAESANLSECHLPLFDFIVAQSEPARIATRKAFGAKTRGWTARTSQNIFGGNAWNWNIPSSAWYATHAFEHWSFTRDRAFLEKTAYPMLKEICQMWEDRLKPMPDGSLVVPNGWSPEHGPHEDGVMHDQQLIWELFQDYIEASVELNIDAPYRATIAGLQKRLAPNKIGKWGQLQEWQTDRDDPDDQHRHTSHLFAVYPGRQISLSQTPDLAKAAIISLRSRSGNYGKNADKPFTVSSTIGDSRQSWTWPWRGAMWARLGEGEKAGIMVRGLLTYNTTPNLFAVASGVFQMDGNFGIPAAMTEMLLQSHAGEISLLPAIPAEWAKSGSFEGLRARGNYTVDCSWKDGKVTDFKIHAAKPGTVKVRVNGELKDVAVVR